MFSFRKDTLEAQGSAAMEGTTYGDIQLFTDAENGSYLALVTKEGVLTLLDENCDVIKQQKVGENVLSAPMIWEDQLYLVTDTQLIGLKAAQEGEAA